LGGYSVTTSVDSTLVEKAYGPDILGNQDYLDCLARDIGHRIAWEIKQTNWKTLRKL